MMIIILDDVVFLILQHRAATASVPACDSISPMPWVVNFLCQFETTWAEIYHLLASGIIIRTSLFGSTPIRPYTVCKTCVLLQAYNVFVIDARLKVLREPTSDLQLLRTIQHRTAKFTRIMHTPWGILIYCPAQLGAKLKSCKTC